MPFPSRRNIKNGDIGSAVLRMKRIKRAVGERELNRLIIKCDVIYVNPTIKATKEIGKVSSIPWN